MSALLRAEAVWLGGPGLARDVTLGMVEGRITIVPGGGPAAPGPLVEGVLVLGLTDQHVHTELVDIGPLLAAGITGVRDLGGDPDTVFALAADSQDAPDIPTVEAVGPFLTAPGGYPTGRAWTTQGMAIELPGPDEAQRAVHAMAGRGACAIKVALNSDAGPVPDDVTLDAIVGAANDRGLGVVAHTEGADQPERALLFGVAELAHTPWTSRCDDALVEAMARSMTWVSTLGIHGHAGPSREQGYAIDNLRRFARAGGRVRYGTDLGNGVQPLAVNGEELSCLLAAGLGPDGLLASISTGAADLVRLDGDPLSDPNRLCHAEPVVKNGRLIAGFAENRDHG